MKKTNQKVAQSDSESLGDFFSHKKVAQVT